MSNLKKPLAEVTMIGRLFPSKNVNQEGSGIRVSADLFTGIRKKVNPATMEEDSENGTWTTIPGKCACDYVRLAPMGKAVADSVRNFDTSKDALVKGIATTRDYTNGKGEKRRIMEILVFSPLEIATRDRQNLITLRGNIGSTPVVSPKDGVLTAKFSVAVNRQYRDRDKKLQKETTWFTLQVTDQSGLEKVKTLRKGLLIYAEGLLDTDRTSNYHKPVVHVHPGGLLTVEEEQYMSHLADKKRQEEEDAALEAPFTYDDDVPLPPDPDSQGPDYQEVAESLGEQGLFDQDPVSKAANDHF